MKSKILLVCTLAAVGIGGAWWVTSGMSGANPKELAMGRNNAASSHGWRATAAQAQKHPERGLDSSDGLARDNSSSLATKKNVGTSARPSHDAKVAAAKGSKPLRASTGGSGWGINPAPPSKALIRIDAGEAAPPNFSGHYQRVLLKKEGKADIRVEFPKDEESRQVLVRAIQGGKINGTDNYAVFDLDGDKKEIAFTFESGRESGLSEIILRRGTTEEVLQFWAPTASPQYDPPAMHVTVP